MFVAPNKRQVLKLMRWGLCYQESLTNERAPKGKVAGQPYSASKMGGVDW